jgi:hypothetical protein
MIGMPYEFGLTIILVLIWSLFWKGLALWRSARLGHKYWYIALLVVNTVGILEIIYLYYVTEPEGSPPNTEKGE